MNILVRVDFPKDPSREEEIHQMSRVPCEGEGLSILDEFYTVKRVIHLLDTISGQPAAHITAV